MEQAPNPVLWAESHLLPSRLPAGFIDALENNPGGIGESLQHAQLEGWRELLWFGLTSQPDWSFQDTPSDTSTTVLKRLYRVITRDQPALLISESFPVVNRRGEYSLLGL
jgi:chorismate-pyruvate lyase